MADESNLKQEIETYRQHLSEWSDKEGQFVLIHHTEICGFFEDYVKALTAGYGRFGIVPFLVKKIMQQQQAHTVTRLVAPQVIR